MATATKSTIEGLTTDEVEILKEAYDQGRVLTLDELYNFSDGTENIGHSHLAEFNRQIAEGERCKVDAKHMSESPINVHGLCEDCGVE